ncbi:hypothetical protein A2U01_0061427, partial [Trifolium medium]|nr:hypothetical protein [Trifolium medium]
GRKGCAAWQGENSSRASDDGVSNFAAVEVLSETGSDADVSESCQILLELEAHGRDRSVSDEFTRVLGYTEDEMAGNIPYSFGNSVELVVPLVNCESDKGEGSFLESAGPEHVLEVEATDG